MAGFAPYRDHENVASKTDYAMIRLKLTPETGDSFIVNLSAAARRTPSSLEKPVHLANAQRWNALSSRRCLKRFGNVG